MRIKGWAATMAAGLAAAAMTAAPAMAASKAEILSTMKRATAFMTEKAAVNGGYVWSYLPDFSRRWGELEAKPSMIWIQPPGTATMGHLFLDAYHATGDETYYQAAEKTAGALISGQLPSGGWHYFVDTAGPASQAEWYRTIGKNAWRMEEFHYDWGNATFDDAGTSESMQFLLRLYLEKRDPKYRPALDKAIGFVLESQYPVGGWPQRYPLTPEYYGKGPPYTAYITFNDDVAGENIKFLLMVYQTLGDRRALDAINRAMSVFLTTQQGAPQPGWALQYTLDMKPAPARSYEPLALHTGTTATNAAQLMTFYELTGDTRFLARVPEALDWLEKVKLPADKVKNGRTHPTFVEIGTDRPIYVHRRGSNVVNGKYYWDYSDEALLGHYSGTRAVDLKGLQTRYDKLKATPAAEVAKSSPLLSKDGIRLPKYFANQDISTSDLNAVRGPDSRSAKAADEAVKSLNREGWWPSQLTALSNPYKGAGPATAAQGDFRSTHVGDAHDTSPYPTTSPVVGISLSHYIENMSALIGALEAEGQSR